MDITTISILVLLVVIIIYMITAVKNKSCSGGVGDIYKKRGEKKEKSKQKVLDLFKKQEKITNNDVENMLKISDATATNYLSELEKEGKIIQHGGKTGRNVFYTRQ